MPTIAPAAGSPDSAAMSLALEQARRAARQGEVPVGAVVVADGQVVGTGRNEMIGSCDPTAHAEILALRQAASTLGNYRLTGATLYATVEPCLMCIGAALHARIGRLVYGAADPKVGAAARFEQMRNEGADFNHRLELVAGLMADASADLLLEFFRERRSHGLGKRNGEVPKWS